MGKAHGRHNSQVLILMFYDSPTHLNFINMLYNGATDSFLGSKYYIINIILNVRF